MQSPLIFENFLLGTIPKQFRAIVIERPSTVTGQTGIAEIRFIFYLLFCGFRESPCLNGQIFDSIFGRTCLHIIKVCIFLIKRLMKLKFENEMHCLSVFVMHMLLEFLVASAEVNSCNNVRLRIKGDRISISFHQIVFFKGLQILR